MGRVGAEQPLLGSNQPPVSFLEAVGQIEEIKQSHTPPEISGCFSCLSTLSHRIQNNSRDEAFFQKFTDLNTGGLKILNLEQIESAAITLTTWESFLEKWMPIYTNSKPLNAAIVKVSDTKNCLRNLIAENKKLKVIDEKLDEILSNKQTSLTEVDKLIKEIKTYDNIELKESLDFRMTIYSVIMRQNSNFKEPWKKIRQKLECFPPHQLTEKIKIKITEHIVDQLEENLNSVIETLSKVLNQLNQLNPLEDAKNRLNIANTVLSYIQNETDGLAYPERDFAINALKVIKLILGDTHHSKISDSWTYSQDPNITSTPLYSQIMEYIKNNKLIGVEIDNIINMIDTDDFSKIDDSKDNVDSHIKKQNLPTTFENKLTDIQTILNYIIETLNTEKKTDLKDINFDPANPSIPKPPTVNFDQLQPQKLEAALFLFKRRSPLRIVTNTTNTILRSIKNPTQGNNNTQQNNTLNLIKELFGNEKIKKHISNKFQALQDRHELKIKLEPYEREEMNELNDILYMISFSNDLYSFYLDLSKNEELTEDDLNKSWEEIKMRYSGLQNHETMIAIRTHIASLKTKKIRLTFKECKDTTEELLEFIRNCIQNPLVDIQKEQEKIPTASILRQDSPSPKSLAQQFKNLLDEFLKEDLPILKGLGQTDLDLLFKTAEAISPPRKPGVKEASVTPSSFTPRGGPVSQVMKLINSSPRRGSKDNRGQEPKSPQSPTSYSSTNNQSPTSDSSTRKTTAEIAVDTSDLSFHL